MSLDRNALPSEHIEAKIMEFVRKGILAKRQTVNGQNQELVTTELNMSNPLVIDALADWSPTLVDASDCDDEQVEALELAE